MNRTAKLYRLTPLHYRRPGSIVVTRTRGGRQREVALTFRDGNSNGRIVPVLDSPPLHFVVRLVHEYAGVVGVDGLIGLGSVECIERHELCSNEQWTKGHDH